MPLNARKFPLDGVLLGAYLLENFYPVRRDTRDYLWLDGGQDRFDDWMSAYAHSLYFACDLGFRPHFFDLIAKLTDDALLGCLADRTPVPPYALPTHAFEAVTSLLEHRAGLLKNPDLSEVLWLNGFHAVANRDQVGDLVVLMDRYWL